MSQMEGLQLDLATLLVRLAQIAEDPDGTLAPLLLDRVLTCDLPRLRGYLTPDTLAFVGAALPGASTLPAGPEPACGPDCPTCHPVSAPMMWGPWPMLNGLTLRDPGSTGYARFLAQRLP